MKFVKNGIIKIIVKKIEKNTISLEIQDNGSGINEEMYGFIIYKNLFFSVSILSYTKRRSKMGKIKLLKKNF